MNKKAIIVLADGFEEIEAVTTADVLRRADIDVIIAGLTGYTVTGAHGMVIRADTVFHENDPLPDAFIFPGGLPGAENLAGSAQLKNVIIKMNSEKRIIAAICAAPALLLAPAGVLNGREATCYPGMEKSFGRDTKAVNAKVVQSDNIITSQGPATSFIFALKIVETLAGKDRARKVSRETLFGA
ncbi:MAG: DJ-1 family glyoxalase III [Candidatus Omnitrophota bacterium]